MDEKSKKKISVYNTTNHTYEQIKVTDDVATVYKRTKWNIEDNDKSFYDHEIQMSGLIGGENNAFESFREFFTTENSTENLVLKKLLVDELYKALKTLDENDFKIIYYIFFENKTEEQCAEKIGVSQQMISRKKKRILKNLKEILKRGL